MKKVNSLLLGMLALLVVTACSKEDTDQGPVLGPDETLIQFNLDASQIVMDAVPMSRATKTYSKAGFRITAFRKNTTDGKFYFAKNIDLTNFTFSGNKLSGKTAVMIGTYKFLITYGASTTGLTFPGIFTAGGVLDETAKITAGYSNTGLTDELFLQTRHQTAQGTTAAGKLREYEFKISGETSNDPVNEVLQRAVARLDVLLVSATKAGGIYTEKKFVSDDPANPGKDIIDNRAMKLTFQIGSLPTQLSLIGSRSNTPAVANTSVALNYKNASAYTNNDKVTIGTGNATQVGKSTFLAYDNIVQTDIIEKGAHFTGNYFFPFASTKTTVKLTLEGSKSTTDVITRTIDFANVPFEQNKVTLLRVYVLSGGSVFDTEVSFGVDVVTDWLAPNVVDAEVN